MSIELPVTNTHCPDMTERLLDLNHTLRITCDSVLFQFSGLLTFLGVVDLYFVNHAYYSTLIKGASVQLVFGFEVGIIIWTTSSEFGTYRLCEQRRFRRACASAQSRQNLRCSLIQAMSQEEPSDRKPDPWLL